MSVLQIDVGFAQRFFCFQRQVDGQNGIAFGQAIYDYKNPMITL
jgi:hypothetical protein